MKNLITNIKEISTSVLRFSGLAYWVEIVTDNPRCTYYFGPFLSTKEANEAKAGYIEDLDNESAQIIFVKVQRCQPSNLTIFDETTEVAAAPEITPALSGHMS
ncbi:MAG: DUF1816 domain-containing protein [Symploca sp. SIO2E6]|nr:DUF1816 domain-containing protein [Symploca sp. SIO2E6]